jgi:hypothetical protein
LMITSLAFQFRLVSREVRTCTSSAVSP